MTEIYDGDGVMEGAEGCVDLTVPFLVNCYNKRKESDETIKLQIVTENSVLRVVTHNVKFGPPRQRIPFRDCPQSHRQILKIWRRSRAMFTKSE